MNKTVSAIAGLAVLAGTAMLLAAMTPEAAAVAPVATAKSDRADTPGSCDRQGWPYYDANCLRDESRNAGRVPQVRIVTTDRVQVDRPAPAIPDAPMPADDATADRTSAIAVPAWPEYMANLQVLAIR